MEAETLHIIRAEHDALSAVLQTVRLLARQPRPDFDALRAMLFYVDEFPERRHHPHESELLFPKLRALAPQSRELLDKLDADHGRGERAVRALQHELLAYELLGEARRPGFERAVQRYVDGYLQHMAMEEREILPLAERVLRPQDWAELDETFAKERDPLTGGRADAAYERLFQRILRLVPPPLGLGPA
ncbi:MAG: hemerythrin domain-containing protein [Roseateles asaccharophilus]|uniref:Hemerythrin-like domain-containing protein n=1 Tax=Roseateles asaccharophilus TaxID=582607 RepID=A0A4V3CKC9_9BURK|nr:hemerythrin domain-containing protein [Roseateles asaccharophilus]MDN3542914.1 hemerythrin domain-containing protein [Roseateles asaccharophilus]TDP13387.1 hemerythrin-like domain-containing protein [Roseateles asaccharophilus]